jgi:hypothetical protein
MKIKHSKYKNSGLIFELLVKQVAADTLNKKDSAAVSIIRKFYAGNTSLAKEYRLYEFVTKNNKISQNKAEAIVSTIIEISSKLNQESLKRQRYQLIAEIKKNYSIEDFFAIKVRDYKPLAALYCLMEAQNNSELINPNFIVDNKVTILEHLTSDNQDADNVKDTLIEEYSKYDKDLRLLAYKLLLEKFNSKYKDLLPEQKNILKEFITSVSSTNRLRDLVNKEIVVIKERIEALADKVNNEVTKIKLNEVITNISEVSKKEKVNESHLVNLMQYYELINELQTL